MSSQSPKTSASPKTPSATAQLTQELAQLTSPFERLLRLKGLEDVRSLISSKFISDSEVLRTIPEYLFSLGGKQLRPVFTLLCGRALSLPLGYTPLVEISSGIELIHMATLLHDDIIDNSPLRRHQPSPFARFGLAKTLLSGDFLLVRAFSLCARLESEIIDATERACIHLTEGEVDEFSVTLDGFTIEKSTEIARKKTAALFRLGAFSAAHLARLSPSLTEEYASFGEHLGIAFQIIDDILDITSSADTLGKLPGTDIRERKPSLINTLWLASGDEMAQSLLLEPGDPSAEAIERGVEALKASKVIFEARRKAQEYAETALSKLRKVRAEVVGRDLPGEPAPIDEPKTADLASQATSVELSPSPTESFQLLEAVVQFALSRIA